MDITPPSKLQKQNSGWYKFLPTPEQSDLNSFYRDLYWQGANKTSLSQYSDLEINYFRQKSKLSFRVIDSLLHLSDKKSRLLDIGCGEGWDLSEAKKYFKVVKGLDFSSFGIGFHNPSCLEHS